MGRIRTRVLCVLVLAAMFVPGRGVWPGKDILWAQDGTTVQTTEAAETADLRAETAEVSDGGAEESVDASENLPASFVYTGEDPYMPPRALRKLPPIRILGGIRCRWRHPRRTIRMNEKEGAGVNSGRLPRPTSFQDPRKRS